MAGEQDAADFAILMQDRQADRFLQKGAGNLHFQLGEQAVLRPLPTCKQLALRIEHLSLRHLLGGSNQRQGFSGSRLVVKHHRRFHGVADRAGNQLQVVIGVNPQRQNAQQGQRDTGHRHGHQRHNQMPATDDRAQRGANFGIEQTHGTAALRRDNCSTLG